VPSTVWLICSSGMTIIVHIRHSIIVQFEVHFETCQLIGPIGIIQLIVELVQSKLLQCEVCKQLKPRVKDSDIIIPWHLKHQHN
jgi:hypothetical protein